MAGTIYRWEFDPFDLADIPRPPRARRAELLEKAAEYILESVLKDVGAARSPVTGHAFPKLNPEYAKDKRAQGSRPIANLELHGDMLDKLVVKPVRGGKLALYVNDASQQGKVDGHNNFTGQSKLPRRKFIPDDGETLRPAIREGLASLLTEEE